MLSIPGRQSLIPPKNLALQRLHPNMRVRVRMPMFVPQPEPKPEPGTNFPPLMPMPQNPPIGKNMLMLPTPQMRDDSSIPLTPASLTHLPPPIP